MSSGWGPLVVLGPSSGHSWGRWGVIPMCGTITCPNTLTNCCVAGCGWLRDHPCGQAQNWRQSLWSGVCLVPVKVYVLLFPITRYFLSLCIVLSEHSVLSVNFALTCVGCLYFILCATRTDLRIVRVVCRVEKIFSICSTEQFSNLLL